MYKFVKSEVYLIACSCTKLETLGSEWEFLVFVPDTNQKTRTEVFYFRLGTLVTVLIGFIYNKDFKINL